MKTMNNDKRFIISRLLIWVFRVSDLVVYGSGLDGSGDLIGFGSVVVCVV